MLAASAPAARGQEEPPPLGKLICPRCYHEPGGAGGRCENCLLPLVERADAIEPSTEPATATEQFAVAVARFEAGDAKAAVSLLEEALALDPASDIALLMLAEARIATGDLEGAESALDGSLELRPGSVFALTRRGIVRLRRGEREGALADLRLVDEYLDRLRARATSSPPPPRGSS